MKKVKLQNENSHRIRRGSVQALHDNMLDKLLKIEAESEEQRIEFNEEIERLKHELRYERLKNEQLVVNNHQLNSNTHQSNEMEDGSDDDILYGDESGIETHGRPIIPSVTIGNFVVSNENTNCDPTEMQGQGQAGICDTMTGDMTDISAKDFSELWDEDNYDSDANAELYQIRRLKATVKELERQLRAEQENVVEVEKTRQHSIHNLHNNMCVSVFRFL